MSELGPSTPQPTRLDNIKNRLESFSIPKVDQALKRNVQKAALAGILGLSALAGSEDANVRFTQAPPIAPSPTSTYIPDLHEEKDKTQEDTEIRLERLVIDQLIKSAKVGQDIAFSIDHNGEPVRKNDSPQAIKAQHAKMKQYLHSDSPEEIEKSRQLLNKISQSDISPYGFYQYFFDRDVFIIDSRFVVSVRDGEISAYELTRLEPEYKRKPSDPDYYLGSLFIDVPKPLLDRFMKLYPNNILSRYYARDRENTGSIIQFFSNSDPDQKLDITKANQLIDLIEQTIPHETRPTPELQEAYDIKYAKILTTIGIFSRNTNLSIEKIAHYIELAKKTPDQETFNNTIQTAIAYEDNLEAKRQGNKTYSKLPDSTQNEYSFDDYYSVVLDIKSEDPGAYYSLGGIITGLQAMGVPPTEAKPFLQKLKAIDDRARNILKARGESTKWTGLIYFTDYSLSSVSNLEEALQFAELMLQGYSNPAIDPYLFSSYTKDLIFDSDPSASQLTEFIHKLQDPQLIPAGQGHNDERDRKIKALMVTSKIASDDPVAQKNIDNFFHNRGFTGNIAHSLLTMPDVSSEIRNHLITGADFANDQATIAMLARVINKTVEGKHSDEFVRKAVEFADAIHRYQDENLHDTSDSLRKDYYIGNLSALALLKFTAVKGRASDFEALTYTSSFVKSYDKLKQSLSSEEYYQMLKENPDDAALLAVMLGRYGKLDTEVKENPQLFKNLIGHALEKYKGHEGFVSEELQSLLVEGIVAGVMNPASSQEYTDLVIEMYKSYPQYRPLASYIMSAHKDAFLTNGVPGYVREYIDTLPALEKPSPPKWEGDEIKFGLYYVKEGANDTPASVGFFKKQGFAETVEGDVRHLTKALPNGKKIIIDIRFDKPNPAHGYQLIGSLIHSYETNKFFEKQPPGSFAKTIIFGGSCRSASEITNLWNRGYDGSQFIVSESIGNPYVNLLVIDGIVKAVEAGGGTIASWDDVENRMKGMLSVYGVKLSNSDRVMFLEYVHKHQDKFPGLKLPQQGATKFDVSPS